MCDWDRTNSPKHNEGPYKCHVGPSVILVLGLSSTRPGKPLLCAGLLSMVLCQVLRGVWGEQAPTASSHCCAILQETVTPQATETGCL